MSAAKKKSPRVLINNKRASFDYEFLEQYDAGKASLADAWCYFSGGELYVKGMNISTYFWASKWGSHEPARDRKLLLTRRELRHLEQATKTKGLTIVAVRAYIADNGFAKLHIALARGKKEFDKRATIREKDIRRELERG